ncbi:MAG TPA: DUF523 domain-containing protein, partial [Aquificae bacterium]|nr:DUF523 domain-containing protein [Aquificota bacterium]
MALVGKKAPEFTLKAYDPVKKEFIDVKLEDYKGKFLEKEKLIPIPLCPESMGGLPIPRPPAKIKGKDGFEVLDGKAKVIQLSTNKDVTLNFLKGTYDCFKIVKLLNLKVCLLKEKSPSCGVNYIYKFEVDELKEGKGVFAAFLSRNNIKVFSEDD